MSAGVTRGGIIIAVLLVLGAVNGSIVAKERIKTHGQRILLELAPVDPRSLMQGDYMALRFTLARSIDASSSSSSSSGSAPLELDANGVAKLGGEKKPGSLRIRYRIRNGEVWLGTNAYFFEEGNAAQFEQARYGEFRLDRDTGEAVLTGMVDAEFRPL